MSLGFTGERFLPTCAGEMVYEHWHRYLFAREHVSNKRVLDVASGEGYGSALLSERAATVVGVDISIDAVRHAHRQYVTEMRSNLGYLCASCSNIPLPEASFDIIVSFETIEHMAEHPAFMQEVDRLLAPGGMFIISSPNRVEYTERTGYKNEFHVKELDRRELKTLLDGHFSAQRWFAQRPCFQSLIWPMHEDPVSAKVLAIDGEKVYPAELYYLVCCARDPEDLREITPTLSLVADRENSVYAEWSRTYAENRELQAQVAELQRNLQESRTRPDASPLGFLEKIRRWLG